MREAVTYLRQVLVVLPSGAIEPERNVAIPVKTRTTNGAGTLLKHTCGNHSLGRSARLSGPATDGIQDGPVAQRQPLLA